MSLLELGSFSANIYPIVIMHTYIMLRVCDDGQCYGFQAYYAINRLQIENKSRMWICGKGV
jgi:hypothetical protein